MNRTSFLSIVPLLLLALALLGSCAGGNGTVATANTHSPNYHADSLRLFARADTHYDREEYPAIVPLLDSVFRLPLQSSATPDGLTEAEATLFCRKALRELMVNYNITRNVDDGYRLFDRIEQMHLPIVEQHCRMALWGAKAQMLMPLGRHAEALNYLNRAAAVTDESDSPDYEVYWTAAIGVTYMGVDTIDTRARQVLHRCVDVARRTGVTNQMYHHGLARLADIYLQQGRYEESIDLCRQALDMSNPEANHFARLVAAENLTKAYSLLRMWDEALHYCAIGTSYLPEHEVHNNLKGRFYLAKATIHAERQQTDSMLTAVHCADSCFRRTGDVYMRLLMDIEHARFLSYVPDSLPTALRRFDALVGEVPPHRRQFFDYYRGDVLVRAREWQQAIPVLNDAIGALLAIREQHLAGQSARMLARCYREAGQAERLAEFFPRYLELTDSVTATDRLRQLATANIRFATREKESRNRVLSAEVESKRGYLIASVATGAALLLAVCAIGWVYIARRRSWNLQRVVIEQNREVAESRLALRESELRQLVATRQELNNRNRYLLAQLTTIQAEHDDTCHLDKVIESLQSTLITTEEEEVFRTAFLQIYPTAMNRLRTCCPGITRSEELFAMLATMKLNTEEIARTLGIARKSVTKIRYRLRPKLNLPEEEDVDACLRAIIQSGTTNNADKLPATEDAPNVTSNVTPNQEP